MQAARLTKKRIRYTPLEERKMWHFFVNELRTGSIGRTGVRHLWKRYVASGQSTKNYMGLESHFRKIMVPRILDQSEDMSTEDFFLTLRYLRIQLNLDHVKTLERKFRCRINTTKDGVFCRAHSRDMNNPFDYPTTEEINTILRDDEREEGKKEETDDELSEHVNDENNMDSTDKQPDSQSDRSSDSDQQPISSKKAKESVKAPSLPKKQKNSSEKSIQCDLIVGSPLRVFTNSKQTNSAFKERGQTLLSDITAERSDRTHSPTIFCISDDNDFLPTQSDRQDIVVYAPDSQVKKLCNGRNSREIEFEEAVASSPEVSSTQPTNTENQEGRDSVSPKEKRAPRRCLNLYEAHARNSNIERSDTTPAPTHGQILHEYENQSARKSIETSSATEKNTDDSSGIADKNIHQSTSSNCPNPKLVRNYKSRLTSIFKNAFPTEKGKAVGSDINTEHIFDGFSPTEQDCLRGIRQQIEWLLREDGLLPNHTQ